MTLTTSCKLRAIGDVLLKGEMVLLQFFSSNLMTFSSPKMVSIHDQIIVASQAKAGKTTPKPNSRLIQRNGDK